MTYISPQLWRNLRVYQIYGANTDVGKTVIATILGKGIQTYRGDRISYLKPISTGPLQESDAGYGYGLFIVFRVRYSYVFSDLYGEEYCFEKSIIRMSSYLGRTYGNRQ